MFGLKSHFALRSNMSNEEKMPLVSAVIPTHNRPQLVLRAVRSALNQTYINLEVVVVVDGPEPKTIALLESLHEPRLHIVTLQQNMGSNTARNIGIRKAIGEWIALLDDDDEWFPEKISKQVVYMFRSNANINFIVCRCIVRRSKIDVIRPRRLPLPSEDMGEYCYCYGQPLLFPSSGLIKKILLIAVPFSEEICISDDHDWLFRAMEVNALIPGWMDDVLAIIYAGDLTSKSNQVKSWKCIHQFALQYREKVLSPKAFSYCLLREGFPAIKRNRKNILQSFKDLLQFLFSVIFIGKIDFRFCVYFCIFVFLKDGTRRKLSLMQDRIKNKRSFYPSFTNKSISITARPKILFIDTGDSFAGVEVYLENLVSILKDKSELFAFCVNPDLGKSLRRAGVHVFMVSANLGKTVHLLIAIFLIIKLRIWSKSTIYG